MISIKKSLVTGAALLLVVAVGAPSMAGAGPRATLAAGTKNPAAAGVANAKQKGTELLAQRIATAVQRRGARFDPVAERLSTRLARVQALADKVEAAGQDVSAIQAALDGASTHLDNAKSLEQQAIAAFEAVPSATDRHAAFQQARELGRQAGSELRSARTDLQTGIKALRTIVQALKASNGTAGTNVQ